MENLQGWIVGVSGLMVFIVYASYDLLGREKFVEIVKQVIHATITWF